MAARTKSGPGLEAPEKRNGSPRFPFVETIVHNGDPWFRFRMDTTFVDSTTEAVFNGFCFDLNDAVFTPGDTICFAFCAKNGNGTSTYWSEFTGATTDLNKVLDCPMEFTVLPAGGWARGGNILYVDASGTGGARSHFESDFKALGLDGLVDRYDQRSPSSLENGSISGRVVNVNAQVGDCYATIIWNSGDLPIGSLADGSLSPFKADDYALLQAFLAGGTGDKGLYLSGDHLAEEWLASAGGAARVGMEPAE